MSRFGMGYGKDPPKDIQGTRPAVRIHSSRNQEILNKWFQPGNKQRPDWFETTYNNSQPKPKQGETGEWQLVWHPRSRMDSPTMPARKVLRTLKDDEEQEKIKKLLAQRLSKMGNSGAEPEQPATLTQEDLLPPLSRSSKRLQTAGSARSNVSRASRHRHPDDQGDGEEEQQSRAGTSSTRGSRRSRSVLSMSSTVTRNTAELMDRIKGLEEALKTEQQLRQKMQSLIALETLKE